MKEYYAYINNSNPIVLQPYPFAAALGELSPQVRAKLTSLKLAGREVLSTCAYCANEVPIITIDSNGYCCGPWYAASQTKKEENPIWCPTCGADINGDGSGCPGH
ncbi:MAG: hypothetical protein H0U76_29080 [Ktedonobacteraceae bacterium]|nr:hypothetical protein [Ktedonobacteraceae bacterium]